MRRAAEARQEEDGGPKKKKLAFPAMRRWQQQQRCSKIFGPKRVGLGEQATRAVLKGHVDLETLI